ncbi:hypothetical protein [Paenibacillus elgii]|uniref:hypothetical protein n=1 Tax=Paenibacillus elgii TaxID=189691 RepID=UPI00203E1684|nr:hypothetical protein [Paenibacillus elgii]MCM3273780.1 hypothetical protein [Paenibacillus elgii]
MYFYTSLLSDEQLEKYVFIEEVNGYSLMGDDYKLEEINEIDKKHKYSINSRGEVVRETRFHVLRIDSLEHLAQITSEYNLNISICADRYYEYNGELLNSAYIEDEDQW